MSVPNDEFLTASEQHLALSLLLRAAEFSEYDKKPDEGYRDAIWEFLAPFLYQQVWERTE